MKIIEKKIVKGKGKKRSTKKTHKSKAKKISIVIFLCFTITISVYLGIGIFIFMDMSSYNQDLGKYYWTDGAEYKYTGDRSFQNAYSTANWTLLESRAYQYENWTDFYNICNESWDCATTLTESEFEYGMYSPFYNNSWNYQKDLNDFMNNESSKFRQLRSVIPIGGYGDSPMWTGNYMASLAFHYAVACRTGNVNEINEVLRKLQRPTDGLNVLTHVSGLRGNLARFAIKDTPANRIRFVDFFYKTDATGATVERTFGSVDNKYPGQGIYQGWWYQMGTSRDQHIGLFFGYSITYKLLSQTISPTGVNTTLRDSILLKIASDGSDVLDCLIGSNWHVINGEEVIGEGRGVDGASLHPRIPWTSGGDIILGFLAFGKMVNSSRYSSYYNQILNRFLSAQYHFTIDQSAGYYGNNLAFESLFQAYFLETDLNVKAVIRHHFNVDYYEYIQYHRNSFFNLGWLKINEYLNTSILSDVRLTYKLDDIVDNLDRFAKKRYPSRNWYIPAVADAALLVHPKAKLYSEIFAKNSTSIIKSLYGWLFEEFSDTSQKSSFALGVDELGSTDFVWQRNPFSVGGTHSSTQTYQGKKQNAGVDFTLPYWMGRYFNYFLV